MFASYLAPQLGVDAGRIPVETAFGNIGAQLSQRAAAVRVRDCVSRS